MHPLLPLAVAIATPNPRLRQECIGNRGPGLANCDPCFPHTLTDLQPAGVRCVSSEKQVSPADDVAHQTLLSGASEQGTAVRTRSVLLNCSSGLTRLALFCSDTKLCPTAPSVDLGVSGSTVCAFALRRERARGRLGSDWADVDRWAQFDGASRLGRRSRAGCAIGILIRRYCWSVGWPLTRPTERPRSASLGSR